MIYICPVCAHVQNINGTALEQYSPPCERCAGTVLYRNDAYGKKQRALYGTVDVEIVRYKVNKQCAHDLIFHQNLRTYMGEIKPRIIPLQTVSCRLNRVLDRPGPVKVYFNHPHVHGSQWLSSIGRLYNWCEMYHSSPSFITGYYLVFDPVTKQRLGLI